VEFHIRCNAQDIAPYVFVPGDHVRAKLIANHFKDARLVSESRGYLVYSGVVEDIFMTVCSTGMGGPQVAIALEELGHMGAHTFIRVGSCGVLQKYLAPGDVIISTGAYRAGGTSLSYLPLNFPAVPNLFVTNALVEAAAELSIPAHIGLGSAGDAFYAPRSHNRDAELRDALIQSGVLSLEMESDTLYIVSSYRGWRAGALYASDGAFGIVKPVWGEEAFRRGEQNAIRIALRAMAKIARNDQKKNST
jgi:uridine phosphorylase